jgi:hypothetical protein
LIEARNEADSILRATRQALTRAQPDERAAIEPLVAKLETAVAAIDHNRIRDVIDELNEASTPLAQRLMDSSIRDALSQKRVSDLE